MSIILKLPRFPLCSYHLAYLLDKISLKQQGHHFNCFVTKSFVTKSIADCHNDSLLTLGFDKAVYLFIVHFQYAL